MNFAIIINVGYNFLDFIKKFKLKKIKPGIGSR